jgi:ATP-binding cassette, subfamily B, bacterial MsbA
MSAAPVRVPTTSSDAESETTGAATGPAASTPARPVAPGQPPPPRSKSGTEDGEAGASSQRVMYRRLLAFLRPHRWLMVSAIASSILAAGLDGFSFAMLIPFLQSLFGDQPLPVGSGPLTQFLSLTIGSLLKPADKMGSLQVVIVIILVAVTAKNIFVWLGGNLGAQLQEYVTRDMRNSVYAHLARLPLPYFTRTRGGQITARILVDTDQTKALITQLVTSGFQNIAFIIVNLAVMFAISWRLSLISLVVAPAVTGILQPLLRRLRKNYRRLREDYGEMMSVLQEVVAGMRLVKSFRGEPYEEQRFEQASGRYSQALVRVTKLALLSQPITEILGTVVAAGLLWIAAREVLVDHTLLGSQLIVFLAVLLKTLQPLKQVTLIPTTAQASFAAAERFFEILDEPTETATDRGTRTAGAAFDSVQFDGVCFAYAPERDPVLIDVSFTARRGDVVAIVGASGAGKSTLVDLIPRFAEPTAGRIFLGGVDTRDIALPALRSLTGIVSQDTVLFNDSVRRNIAYGGDGQYTDSEVEQAARAANAHGFISELPQGYDTVLGERGTRLSGGQRQRLAIARALLRDPPILILDEATSSLDTESERLVQEAIDRLLTGRTVFVIAHRLSTVAHANQILVLDRGRVVERGTHDELLALRGAYYRLYALQFRDGEGVEAEALDGAAASGSSS